MASIRKWTGARSDILQIVALLLALYIGYILVMRPDDVGALERRVVRLENWKACMTVASRLGHETGRVPDYDRCTDAGR